jgi:Ser/Thr protein kinase RdoA (MazF antagonist)
VSSPVDDPITEVLASLGVGGGAKAALVRRFGQADVWLAEHDGRQSVLKRGRPEQDEADVAWEHEHLSRLAEVGFPASAPVPELGGRSWTRIEGRIWAALTYLPGRPLASEPKPDFEAAGALLARYHHAVRLWPVPEQRPTAAGLSRLREVTPLDRVRAALGEDTAYEQYLRLLADLEAALRALGYDGVEHLVIHGDPTNDNAIVAGSPSRIVGLIDFGAAHVAPWPADLAAALWRSGRPGPNAIVYDLRRIGRYVAGYHRASPIPPELVRAISLLMIGRGLQLISRRVRRLPPGQPSAPIPDTMITFRRALWLRTRQFGIGYAIEDALARARTEEAP